MNETDEQWMDLFKRTRGLMEAHSCKARAEGDRPVVEITAEEKCVSTTQWTLEKDGHFEDDGDPDGRANEVNFLKVECADCQARLMGGWNFRNIDDGSIKNIDAPTLDDAWKILESEYSDPVHATQEWAAMEV